jgi:hypothetical protein
MLSAGCPARHSDMVFSRGLPLNTFVVPFVIGLVVFGAMILFALLTRALTRYPYRKTNYLLTRAEYSFFVALRQAIGSNLYVFSKVRLSDLLWIPKGTKNRQSYLNRIQSKHVDFVLCDAVSTEPRLLIELDDSSHQRVDRKARDAFLDKALGSAGLAILHVPAKGSYAAAELRSLVSSALAGAADTAPPGVTVDAQAE